MNPERVLYCCEMCRGDMYVEVRDIGFFPKIVPCVKCEGFAELTSFGVLNEPSFKLIIPDLREWIKYSKSEEARYLKQGFSKIECCYLIEHDLRFLQRGGLILTEI